MPLRNREQIVQAALNELAEEEYRALVDKEKAAIRERRARARWWHTLIPFTITITRRQPNV